MPRNYFVYILASDSRELYIGVTNNRYKRVAQHRNCFDPGSYSIRHRTLRLAYAESTRDIISAIRREKQLKGWTRRKKFELIDRANPDWRDLAEGV